ncbi:MAG: SPFH/Band 7/PHB domain protein, partial [Methylobacteriaceae bacterium]|nr:SPFH/Band 7/PHB domain protein [Methylobacteriaceae bacterium]
MTEFSDLSGQSTFLIALAIVALLAIALGVRQVPQGYRYTIERFGRYARTIGPGIGFLFPILERVGHRVNIMEQVLDIETQEAFTKDNAGVTLDAVAFFKILEPSRASYAVSNLYQALLVLTMTNMRTVVGSMDLDELLSHRDRINESLLRVVDAAASEWGVKVTRIEIKDIIPPKDLAGAMARQMKAERDKRAAILEAEGKRQAAILEAEGAKQAKILEAEGEKEAAFRIAEARERSAEAEAKATQVVSDAVSQGEMAAVNYLLGQKYVETLGRVLGSPSAKTVFLPIETASIAGTLGGIAEITKAVFKDGDASGRG